VRDTDREFSRLRGLIFESLARPETFGTLLERTDSAMQQERSAGLLDLTSEFQAASDAMMSNGGFGKVESEIEFTFDGRGTVSTGSASAFSVFGLTPGEPLQSRMGGSGRQSLDQLLRGRSSQALFTLFTHPRHRPVPVLAFSQPDGLFRATAIMLRWNSAITPILKSGYKLTDAEIDIVELVFRGHQPKEIAQTRGRSLETVRTQMRKIFSKTDTHGQADIIHLVYGLIATTQHAQTEQTAAAHGNYMITMPCGRRVDVECVGPDKGKPLLFLHGCLAGRRLPQAALQRFQDRLIISPGRPGHGQTQAANSLSVQDVAQNMFDVLDHFDIEEADILTYDLGAPYGLWMAAMRPERVASLTCLAPVPPLTEWKDVWSLPIETRVFAILSKLNPSAAHYLAVLGGQRILRQGPEDFGKIVFANSRFDRDLVDSDRDAQKLFWHGHAWHVERGPYGFLSDAELSSTHWSKGLPRLSKPPIFLSGSHDRNVPKGALQRLAQIVGAAHTEIPDAGHSLLHANPATWASMVLPTGSTPLV